MLKFSCNNTTGFIKKLSTQRKVSQTSSFLSNSAKLDIPNLRNLERGSMCGPTLQGRPLKDFQLLKKMGIENIVDFREDAPQQYAEFCQKNGFYYFKFPLDSIENIKNNQFYQQTGFQKYSAKPLLISMLKKFFDTMKKGHTYIGCQYGIDRTNKGLALNYFMNHNIKPPRLLHWEDETQKTVVNRNVRIVEKVFHHMTSDQKETLGLPQVFRDILSRKMPGFIIENRT